MDKEKIRNYCLKLNTSRIPITLSIVITIIYGILSKDWNVGIYIVLLCFFDPLWRLICNGIRMFALYREVDIFELLALAGNYKRALELGLVFVTAFIPSRYSVLLALAVMCSVALLWGDAIYLETKVKPKIEISKFLECGTFHYVDNVMIFVENEKAPKMFEKIYDYIEFALLICQVTGEDEEDLHFYIDRYYRALDNGKIKRFLHVYGDEEGVVNIIERDILKAEIQDGLDELLRKSKNNVIN